MKFYQQVALVLFAFAVVALAVPTNRPRKPFRPNSNRVHRRIEETTTIRTYQPKYNPFKSTELSTSTTPSVSPLRKNVYSSSSTKISSVKLIEDLSTDPPFIAAPVEEPSDSQSSDPPPSSPESEAEISLAELELSPPILFSTPSPDEVSSSPSRTSSSTSKPLISSTTKKPSSTSAFKKPVLLRPSKSVSPSFKSQQPTLSTSKTLASSVPPSTSGTSLRVPKTVASPIFPSKPSQTSATLVTPSTSAPSSLRSPKSLAPPLFSSFSQTPKSPVSTVLSQPSFGPAPTRSEKSVNLQTSDDSANSASANYSFSYKVTDPQTSQDFGHSENRVGNHTKGRYDVLLPDGRRQVVDYQILNDSGYVADVSYQG
ncbi:putative protein TPRXL [Daphnia pulicaria]|nr:putative protein TPRXL [Daphnia pulicaria]